MGDETPVHPRVAADMRNSLAGHPRPRRGETVVLTWYDGAPTLNPDPAGFHDVTWTYDGEAWITATPIEPDRHAEGNREMALLLERDAWRDLARDMGTLLADARLANRSDARRAGVLLDRLADLLA